MTMRNVDLLIAGTLLVLLGGESANSQDTRRARAPDAVHTGAAATYFKSCATCHAAGNDHAGTVSLAIKYKGEIPAVLIERKDLTTDTVKYFVRHGIATMPPFRKTEITDSELDKLAYYISHQGREPAQKK